MKPGFPAHTAADWKALLAKENKGKTFEDLTYTSGEGLPIKPFYTAQDGDTLPLPPPRGWWAMAEAGPGTDAEVRTEIDRALQLGANGLIVYLLPTNNWEALTAGIDRSLVELLPVSEGHPIRPSSGVRPLWDPLEHFTRTGNWLHSREADLATASPCVLGNYLAQCGAGPVLQVAATLQQAHELLVANGAEWAREVTFFLAVGTDFFQETAKLRALQLLWPQVLAGYGITGSVVLVAETNLRYFSSADPETNLLRTTTMGLAARAGGATGLLIRPFDSLAPKGGELGLRMALNQHFLMQYEGELPLTHDPARGAYLVESLTQDLARAAWELFVALEAQGCYSDLLSNGTYARRVAQQHRDEVQALQDGTQKMVGVNIYRPDGQKEATARHAAPQGPHGLQPIILSQLF